MQAWYMNPMFSVLVGGILPFGAVFIELFFILTSMWLHQFYYLFGFLCLVFVILIITCAEITIVLCYFQLCSEDYHWWCEHSVGRLLQSLWKLLRTEGSISESRKKSAINFGLNQAGFCAAVAPAVLALK